MTLRWSINIFYSFTEISRKYVLNYFALRCIIMFTKLLIIFFQSNDDNVEVIDYCMWEAVAYLR